MKKVLVNAALVFLTVFSNEVFAKKNYFQEYCHMDTSQGEVSFYKSEFWFGHHMTLISDLPGLDDYQEVYLSGHEGRGEDPVRGNEAIVFDQVRDTQIERRDYDDGCWQGFNIYFVRRATVKQIKEDASDLLDLKPESKVELKCRYENLIMSGSKCDEL